MKYLPMFNSEVNLVQNLFFDLDGTLADAREGIVNCLKHAFVELGEPIPAPNDLADCLGPPLWQSFGKLLSDPTETRVRRAIAAYRERFNDVGMFENKLYPNVVDVLSQLLNRGFALFVVTSKPRIPALKIIDHFGMSSLFCRVHGPELDDYSSTKGNLIADVLLGEQIDRASVVMIGDRSYDIIGAQSNGVYSIGVCWGYGSRTELVTAGADQLIESPSDLLNLDVISEVTKVGTRKKTKWKRPAENPSNGQG